MQLKQLQSQVAAVVPTAVEQFKINYATNGNLSSISIRPYIRVSTDPATGGDITINFTGYSYPQKSYIVWLCLCTKQIHNDVPNKDIIERNTGGGSGIAQQHLDHLVLTNPKRQKVIQEHPRSLGTVPWVQVVMEANRWSQTQLY